MRIKVLCLLLVVISLVCFVACEPEEDKPIRTNTGITDINISDLTLEEFKDILIGTWVTTLQGNYGYDTVDFLESGVIHEIYPTYLRNHDGWNYIITRDSIFTSISGDVWNLSEIFSFYDSYIYDHAIYYMEVNNGNPDGVYYRDQYVYCLILYMKDDEFSLIIPDWHPNSLTDVVGELVEFKKMK